MKWRYFPRKRSGDSENWYASIQMAKHAYIEATIGKELPYVERYKVQLVVTNTWTDDIPLIKDETFDSLEEAQYHCEYIITDIAQNIYNGLKEE